jgi:hypothetical protein
VNSSVFKDKEIVWFYAIILSLASLAPLLSLLNKEWGACALSVGIILGFLYFGWPLSAEITKENDILFKNHLRRVLVTPETLKSVKVIGAHDYRAHITFRNRNGIPVGYRCRQYERAPELAQAFLKIIDRTPKTTASSEAIKLLQRVANKKTKPDF